MNLEGMSTRGYLTLLLHGPKIVDVLTTAARFGILTELDRGPVALDELAARTGTRAARLYKFLDVLESAGLVRRTELTDRTGDAAFSSAVPLAEAAEAVLGEDSIERDRERWPWQSIHGRLDDVLRGTHGMSREEFAWPPEGDDQVRAFEASMAAGIPPILETFRTHSAALPEGARVLDIGGGDGALAAGLLADRRDLSIDVYNLPSVEPLVAARALGFVGGDFLEEPLPTGYDVLLFVRVLHDWPPEVAAMLLRKAHAALRPGGRLIVCEEFRSPERLTVQLFWTYFLIGVDGCVSRLREIEWYTSRLAQLGFADVGVRRGSAFDLVEATRAR